MLGLLVWLELECSVRVGLLGLRGGYGSGLG